MLAQARCWRKDFARLVHLAGYFACGVLLGLLFVASSQAQISPGPLSKAHESLSGPLSCTKCHVFGGRDVQLRCLDCHTEIRQRVTQRKGMHAVWVAPSATGKDCVACHSEHNGADFPLIRWQPNREAMDHSKTGFPLTGRHASAGCNDCHKAANIPAAARASILIKDLNYTYLGLSPDCRSCHVDEHRGQLGANCASCHTTTAWKPASGFNHATSKYPLTGAHATVACAKCHVAVADAKPYVKYVGLSFATCTGCHTDPHKGAFTGTCQSCHNTTNWNRVAQLQGFDHAKTDFPLLGKHASVTCADCHTHGDFKTPVAHALCADCHKDVHHGQFAARADKGECGSCHNVEGFKPSTFNVAAHAATMYPLDGRHASVACDQCHIAKGQDTVYKIAQTSCQSCHEDVHKGQFAAAPHQNRCEDCHNVRGFQPAVFALARHQQTRFPLTGAHIAIPCAQCHVPAQPGAAATPVKYRFDDRSCTACHQDPHHDEFRDRMVAKRADGSAAGCEACHSTSTWKLKGFDHSKTDFPLAGAHRGVACADCHRPPNLETSLENVDFRAAPKLCSGCHQDPHGGQFAARKDVADCSSCHTVARWKPAEFNHNTRTPFPLQGAHQNVACGDCHKLTRAVNAQAVLFYKPAPTECKACHGNN